MKPLSSALIFPETEPSVHDIGKLLLFFNSLSYYCPVESINEGRDNKNLFENHCTGYAPAPLLEDLTRFKALLREMENSRSDDLARLFSSSKSPIATGQIRDTDELSSGSVLSALREEDETKSGIQYKERLWQARLILKLAEVLDRRESEVRQGLNRIASVEQKIFASLEGLNETEKLDPEQISDLERFPTGMRKINYPDNYSERASSLLIPIRMKAWAELFLADSSLNRPCVLVTSNPDCASLLLEGYEKNWHQKAEKLFSLSIPEFSEHILDESAVGEYVTTRNRLRKTARESLEYLDAFLRETTANQETGEIQQKHFTVWEEAAKIEFPSPAGDFQKLDFYCFPGISGEILFQKIFNIKPVIDAKNHRCTPGMLAVLHS